MSEYQDHQDKSEKINRRISSDDIKQSRVLGRSAQKANDKSYPESR